VRVIAGRFRGVRLQAPPGRATRPTSDRVREALFSMLGQLEGAEVLDLFAGTGALAIEALSRGANHAVAVEHDEAAVRVLRANMAAVKLALGELELRLIDARRALRTARERRETYDLILIDPPYGHARAWGPELSVALPPLLRPGARVVVECDRRAPLELSIELERERRYGDTSIRIHRCPSPKTS
jgi:16S rRNA (guanine966-N2)-methyltransferase